MVKTELCSSLENIARLVRHMDSRTDLVLQFFATVVAHEAVVGEPCHTNASQNLKGKLKRLVAVGARQQAVGDLLQGRKG